MKKTFFSLLFLLSFFMVLAGCMHGTPEQSINMDMNYSITDEYMVTDPEGHVDLYRFFWIDWLHLASPKRYEDNPPIPFSDRRYRSLDVSYTLTIPKLSGRNVLFDDRQYPGEPTARFIMMDENGWVAGIQSTKIREDYPKDDRLLTEIVAKRRLVIHSGQLDAEGMGRVEMKFFKYDKSLVLEDKTFNALKDLPFFLNSGYGFSNDPGNPIRINRCIVRNGYFIEISVYTVAKDPSDEELTEKAAIEISDYILSTISFK
jgi:hypothetical protein